MRPPIDEPMAMYLWPEGYLPKVANTDAAAIFRKWVEEWVAMEEERLP